MRVAENNGTDGAMMRMSRPQPVSLDKGLVLNMRASEAIRQGQLCRILVMPKFVTE